MNDEDIYAFSPLPKAAGDAPAAPAPRRLWPWVLGALWLLAGVVAACGLLAIYGLAEALQQGLQVSIDGQPWPGGDRAALHGAGALLGLGVAALVVVLVVPFTVLLSLVLAGLAVVLGLTLAAGSVALVVALLLSPLWLLILLLWLALRRKPAAAARMPG